MPGLESHIFQFALSAFLLIGALKLTIEQLITLVLLFKKLKATINHRYVFEMDDRIGLRPSRNLKLQTRNLKL